MWPCTVPRSSRSLDIRPQTDRCMLDKRRSVELARSVRRYDEAWGAAERADTRLKCSDGIIIHVHSQVLSLWSSVLRNMIALMPGPHLLESTHGLALVLNVEESSLVWSAVLDMMYPICRPARPGPPHEPVLQRDQDWVLLEQCLLLADKYDMMPVVTQNLLQHTLFSPAAAPYSLDPNQPSFALHWLGLADRLQLPQLAQAILSQVQADMAQLAQQPGGLDKLLSYADEHLSKQQLLQLLQASMQHAGNNQHQHQHQQELGMMLMMPPVASPGPSHTRQQQHCQHCSGAPWSSAANQAFMAAAAAAAASAAAFSRAGAGSIPQHGRAGAGGGGSCSGSTAPGLEAVDECSSSSLEEEHHLEHQRLNMCQASALFVPGAMHDVKGHQQHQQASMSSGYMGPNPAGPAPGGQPQQEQRVFALPVATHQANTGFGYGVNAGNTSIEEYMRHFNAA